ncbi:MAG: SH3 domain-containing protein [Deltaproteobacteria bacterium]|nr:SH3 domain-containing protein [Deltaproteobacteria bacterium]
MTDTSETIKRFFTICLIAVFTFGVLAAGNNAWAFRHPAPSRSHHRVSIHPLLPLGFMLLTVAGIQYYYHKGLYYQPIPTGYTVVRAPLGAILPQLPPGFVTFQKNGTEYFYYDGVYYNRVPSGYIVVKSPADYPVVDSTARPQASSPAIEQVTVSNSLLNVRSGPGMNHPIVSQVSLGTLLEVHGNATDWLFVRLPSGEFGWVMKKFTASSTGPAEG